MQVLKSSAIIPSTEATRTANPTKPATTRPLSHHHHQTRISRPVVGPSPAIPQPRGLPSLSRKMSTITRATVPSSAPSATPTSAGTAQAISGPKGLIQVFSTQGTNSALELELAFVGNDGYAVGAPVDLSKFACKPWKQDKDSDGVDDLKGIVFEGTATVPTGARTEMVLMRLKTRAIASKEYISKMVVLAEDGTYKAEFAPNTWVHKDQGQRIIFSNTAAYLPQDTPAFLKKWRDAELLELKGAREGDKATKRLEADRIYDYDVYNDLQGKDKKTGKLDGHILGGSAEMPYPRRLRTGREKIAGPNGKVFESRTMPLGATGFWVPLDEIFTLTQKTQSMSYAVLGVASAATELLRRKIFDKDGVITDFAELDKAYAKLADPKNKIDEKELTEELKNDESHPGHKIFGLNVDNIKLLTPVLSAISSTVAAVSSLKQGSKGFMDFPPPMVWNKRERAWIDDEEWGRQILAGVNPCVCVAVTSTAQLGTITEAHLAPVLEGNSLSALLAQADKEPRLMVIDHTAIFEDYAPRVAATQGCYAYSGRAIVYRKNNEQWAPVAIELKGAKGELDVYTSADHPNYWLIARGVFTMLDTGFHQLVTHWLRSHAVTEPFIISTRRNLSSLHPVFRLLTPHFASTLQINSQARFLLIGNGGIVESIMNPGSLALEMCSKVYGALWRFDREALPEDLISRGLAKKDPNTGEVKTLLKDYPYADDGLLMWNAIEKFATKYLALYYDDATPGRKVTDDPEVVAWWKEIVEVGHADKKEGWPELKTIADLARIVTTMIWLASCFHAAVNFSQYAFNGYNPNRPITVLKPIPARGSKEYEALTKDQKAGEKAFCDLMLRPKDVMKATVVMELLSFHSDEEVYMGDPNHGYILSKTVGGVKRPAPPTQEIVNDIPAAITANPKLSNGLYPTGGGWSTYRLVGSAVPVALDSAGRAMIAASTYGKGRVVSYGHEGHGMYLGDTNLSLPGAKWVAGAAYKDDSKPVKAAVLFKDWFGTANLPNLDSRFTTVAAPAISALAAGPAAAGVDVIMTCTHSFWGVTPSEISAVVSFVAKGGGLMVGGHTWNWQQQMPGKNAFTCQPSTALLANFGIMMRSDYATLPPNGVALKPAPSYLLNAEAAVSALTAKPMTLTAEEVKIAQVAVTRTFEVPLGTPGMGPLRKLLEDATTKVAKSKTYPFDEAAKPALDEILKQYAASLNSWINASAIPNIVGPLAVAPDMCPLDLYKEFCMDMRAAEELMKKRNQDPTKKIRTPPGLPYTFLQPTSGPGITYKGVPQSITI